MIAERLKHATVHLLDEGDNLLDHAPALHRDDDGRWRIGKGGWGCRAGVAGVAYRLADRWGVVLKPSGRCLWCGERFNAFDED